MLSVDARKRGKHWVGQLARVGYASIGIVYLLVGALAIMGIFNMGGRFTGSGGAARTIRTWPFGTPLLTFISIGLLIYVIWRFYQAFLDVERRGRRWNGIVRRTGLALSGLSYLGLAIVTLQWLITGGGSVQDPKDDLTVRLMSTRWGAYATGVLGVVVIGVGLFQFLGAFKIGFMQYFRHDVLADRAERTIAWIGRVGLFGRGVVFAVIGFFVVSAAWANDPGEIKGIGGVFRLMGQQPHGFWLIGLVALGFVVYGVFMLSKARYRYVVPVDEEPSYLRSQEQEEEEA